MALPRPQPSPACRGQRQRDCDCDRDRAEAQGAKIIMQPSNGPHMGPMGQVTPAMLEDKVKELEGILAMVETERDKLVELADTFRQTTDNLGRYYTPHSSFTPSSEEVGAALFAIATVCLPLLETKLAQDAEGITQIRMAIDQHNQILARLKSGLVLPGMPGMPGRPPRRH